MAEKQILIIEDESPIRDMIRFALNPAGFNIIEANSITEASSKLLENLPDLILFSTGFQKGKKVFALQTRVPMIDERESLDLVGKISGFSLHAGVSAKANQRDKLERLCRYVARPPVATNRLSLTNENFPR